MHDFDDFGSFLNELVELMTAARRMKGGNAGREAIRGGRRKGRTITAAQQAGVNVVFAQPQTLLGSTVVGPLINVPLTPDEIRMGWLVDGT